MFENIGNDPWNILIEKNLVGVIPVNSISSAEARVRALTFYLGA